MVVEQEVGNLASYSFVANHLHLVGLGPVRPTVTYISHSSLYLCRAVSLISPPNSQLWLSATSLTEVKIFSCVVQDNCVGQNLCPPTVCTCCQPAYLPPSRRVF